MTNKPFRHYKEDVRQHMWRLRSHVYNPDMDKALAVFYQRGYRPQLAAMGLIAVERMAKNLISDLANLSMAQAMLQCATSTKN